MNGFRKAHLRSSGLRALLFLGATGAALCVSRGQAVAGPVAGSSILNTATASGVFALSGTPFVQTSNTVRAIVQPLEAVRLEDDRAAIVAPGLSFAFAHRLTNLGNDRFDFRMDLANAGNDDFDVLGLALVEDVNGNGAFDAGDTAIASGGVITLGAGESADLLVLGAVGASAPGLAAARLALSATGLAQGAFDANVDTVRRPPRSPRPCWNTSRPRITLRARA